MEKVTKKLRSHKSDSDCEESDGNHIHETSPKKNVDQPTCTLTYDIWRLIFKYLNGPDLGSASIVCRTWKEAIESELALRSPQYSLEELSQWKSMRLKNLIQNIKVKPGIVFCFCENGQQMGKLKHCLCSQLPRTCDVVYIDTGVADLRTKSGIAKEIPENSDRAGCVYFPGLKDFDIEVVYRCSSEVKLTRSVIKQLSDNILRQNEKTKKCLFVFCDDDVMSGMHKLLDSIKKNIKSTTLSLLGGRTPHLYYCKYQNKTKERECKIPVKIIVISISKPGMESWSIVIKRNSYDEEQIIEKLTEFREKIHLQKHTCGFMFGCCARIKNKHVEMEAFKKVFPKVPVVCSYGNEEFGVDSLEYNATSKHEKKFYTNYSTIFSIITYS